MIGYTVKVQVGDRLVARRPARNFQPFWQPHPDSTRHR
jgi:hypothetical protein